MNIINSYIDKPIKFKDLKDGDIITILGYVGGHGYLTKGKQHTISFIKHNERICRDCVRNGWCIRLSIPNTSNNYAICGYIIGDKNGREIIE